MRRALWWSQGGGRFFMSEVETLNPKIETLDVEAVMPVDAYTISRNQVLNTGVPR